MGRPVGGLQDAMAQVASERPLLELRARHAIEQPKAPAALAHQVPLPSRLRLHVPADRRHGAGVSMTLAVPVLSCWKAHEVPPLAPSHPRRTKLLARPQQERIPRMRPAPIPLLLVLPRQDRAEPTPAMATKRPLC